MRSIIVIAHNLRSTHNVGSLLRTADAMGVKKVFLTGYTPYPSFPGDTRLPHLASKITRQIQKTALGAEDSVPWEGAGEIHEVIASLRNDRYVIAAVEQAPNATRLPQYAVPEKIALVFGREVEGLEQEIIDASDICLEIPMLGRKESLNVVQAAAMVLYHCRFGN